VIRLFFRPQFLGGNTMFFWGGGGVGGTCASLWFDLPPCGWGEDRALVLCVVSLLFFFLGGFGVLSSLIPCGPAFRV